MDEKAFKEEVLELVGEYFGDYTKILYITFYENKTPKEVFSDFKKLLTEMIGPERTNKVLLYLREKYHLIF